MTQYNRKIKTEEQILLEKLYKQCEKNNRNFDLIVSLIPATETPHRLPSNRNWYTATCDGHKINVHATRFSHGDTSVPKQGGKLAVTNYSYAASVALKYRGLWAHLRKKGNPERARREAEARNGAGFVAERWSQFAAA